MKEYRIVQRTNGLGEKDYTVQAKFCHLIWLTLKEKTEFSGRVDITFYDLDDAMIFVEKRMYEERKRTFVEKKVIVEY